MGHIVMVPLNLTLSTNVHCLQHFFFELFSNLYEHKDVSDCLFTFCLQNSSTPSKRRSPGLHTDWAGLPVASYLPRLSAMITARQQLLYHQFHSTDGDPVVSGVWRPSARRENVYQRHDVSRYGFLIELHETLLEDREVRMFVASYFTEWLCELVPEGCRRMWQYCT